MIRDFDARRPEDRRRVMGMLQSIREANPINWTCGHQAGAQCIECYQQLITRANQLAAENERLREENEILREQLELKL